MLKNIINKIKKSLNIHVGKTMLIDKEGELWELNDKDEAVKISEAENKTKDSPIDTNKNSLAKNKQTF